MRRWILIPIAALMGVLWPGALGTPTSEALAGDTRVGFHIGGGNHGVHYGIHVGIGGHRGHGRHQGHFGRLRHYGRNHGSHVSLHYRHAFPRYRHGYPYAYTYPRYISSSYPCASPSVYSSGPSYTSTVVYAPPPPRATVIYGNPRPATTTYVQGPPPADNEALSEIPGSAQVSAWEHLLEERYQEALTQFGLDAQAVPDQSGPKVGYALASAALGRLNWGTWAMRRAVRTDPNGMQALRLDEQLRPLVDSLIEKYAYAATRPEDQADAAFMVASLQFLLRDREAAAEAIAQAQKAGDQSSSTANLKRMIEQE